MEVDRVLSAYDKSSDVHIEDYALKNIAIPDLQQILGVRKDDPDYYMIHPVNEIQANSLLKFVKEKVVFDFVKYEYFIETSQRKS